MKNPFRFIFTFPGRTSRPESGKVNELSQLGARQYSLAGNVTKVKQDGVSIRFKCDGYDFEAFARFDNFRDKGLAKESLTGVELQFFVRHTDEAGLYIEVVGKYEAPSDFGINIAALIG